LDEKRAIEEKERLAAN